ncbi:methylmalonyl-CoA mutase family protein [Sporosarcina sp. YIM B06819]|uniref:methylmalonyl-CoA mutase family protein n=1 Tax=Sporosarcina sp. YIM B06819 TaxID=3081769 RepID=UPI00298CAD0E|nr:methylmalonyl-CoA mutase family protein [Sporosarcina sp. YIM B06819]
MSIHTMKSTTFEQVDFEQWKEEAVRSLKGKPLESLMTKTLEGIDLQPLYTRESFVEGVRVTKQQTGWIIAQQTHATTGQQFVMELKNSLERGNDAIVYDGTQPVEWDDSSLQEIAQLITDYPVFITNTKQHDSFLKAFTYVDEANRAAVKGAIAVSGWTLPEGFRHVRTSGADTWTAHHNGADAVTELALALAQAAQYMEKHATFNHFAEDFFVRFAVDTHFFMEIAKFRAFRVLWQAFSAAYGVTDAPAIPLLATTSLRSYSKLDPYVNLLRAGNETFAAVLGGADVMTVHPHDVLTGPSDSSVRFARNIQLVIKEETHVDKVIDPAGGSYFIETLTAELVDKAWALFIEIEAVGGYEAFMASGRLATLLEQRRNEVAKGKKSLIGTNVYADVAVTEFADWSGIAVEGRLAEPFENLRSLFSKEQPRTVLLTFGVLKDFKPRADFVAGFLATGGIQCQWSPAFEDAQAAHDWLANEQVDYAIVCATPDMTEMVMETLLKGCPENLLVDVAGKYEPKIEQQWLDAGLNGFLFAGQNRVDKLVAIHTTWKGGGGGEKA